MLKLISNVVEGWVAFNNGIRGSSVFFLCKGFWFGF